MSLAIAEIRKINPRVPAAIGTTRAEKALNGMLDAIP